MKRTVKKPFDRKHEILDAAQKLFLKKGFQETSVSQIVRQVGVAQGTFYYYYKTKDEIMDAIIDRYIDKIIEAVLPYKNDDRLTPAEKITGMAMAELEVNFKYIGDLHSIKSVDIHARILSGMVRKLVPIYAGATMETGQNGSPIKKYSLEITEMIIVASHFLLDIGLFQWTREEFERRVSAGASIMELIMGLDKGALTGYHDVMMKIIDSHAVKKGNIEHKH